MWYRLFFWLGLALACGSVAGVAQGNKRPGYDPPSGKMIIVLEVSDSLKAYWQKENVPEMDSIKVRVVPMNLVGSAEKSYSFSLQPAKGHRTVRLEFKGNIPLFIHSDMFYIPMCTPGDSIYIRFRHGSVEYAGKGAEKCRLFSQLKAVEKSVEKPTKYFFNFTSLEHYLQWMVREEQIMKKKQAILQQFKQRVTAFEYQFESSRTQAESELNKMLYFIVLMDKSQKDSSLGISSGDLCAIWDSTQVSSARQTVASMPAFYGSPHFLYFHTNLQVRRRFLFDPVADSIRNKEKRTYLYYQDAKSRYTGLTRERILTYILDEPAMLELGLQHNITRLMLADYLGQPGFPAHKQWIQQREKDLMLLQAKAGRFDFKLTNTEGKIFTNEDLKGKIALIDFWFTGCKPCITTQPYLQQIEDTFKDDSNVVLVSISTDISQRTWLNSVAGGRYTTPGAVKLYTGGEGREHPMLKFYRVESYPEFHLLDEKGRIVQFPLPKPKSPEGVKEVIQLIRKELERKSLDGIAGASDGPYILYANQQAKIFRIQQGQLDTLSVPVPVQHPLNFSTDRKDEMVPLSLNSSAALEPSEFQQPSRLLSFSDIEGNFGALRQLLRNNSVIDDSYNWTFGNGHLVFAGDMFDRGSQVTECLWLLYSLQQQANAAGGYVHFILGNHELMNLQGNHRYVREKYMRNTQLMGKSLKELYSEHSELGRWLRTKNVVEKIGDILFAHAGISAAINRLGLSIPEINRIARIYYGDTTKTFADTLSNVVMSSQLGPFWYRGYYKDSGPAISAQIDSTLNRFSVNRIVTGHTIVADTISVHYDGKVINTDTHHAGGKSEALLIEGDHFYRVNQEGRKVLLFVDDRRRKSN